ncbi:TetR/AcrR family transcriptional regulator [Alicyclobacillus tolerans]|uniref:AcrR family transcriptional regulator n=1 Tax=Alicyclobacillus tolerans TaxID=90970 RepID=A0ABT9LTH1_9BACL|nr:TetR/AcrR family transcriptional regulator [Alicyclobacillus tengchongensis]MDP9727562.1 AcrR family transcriptional regulator [Alicyclobacillus tengchongensis]
MENDADIHYVQPKTARGQRRVQKILNAAADLIVEEGLDTLTTNAVAKRAQTSIGSVYQFFPNKESILLALADQYRMDLNHILDESLERTLHSCNFSEQLDNLIEKIVLYEVHHLALGVIFQPYKGMATDLLFNEVMSRLVRLLTLWAPHMSREESHLHADICLRVMVALLPVTHDKSEIRMDGVRELKNVLKNYLMPLLKN